MVTLHFHETSFLGIEEARLGPGVVALHASEYRFFLQPLMETN